MTTHHLNLAAMPFVSIADGNKTIESRLFDEKRQAIQVGDHIIFTNRENSRETIEVSVTNLFRHQTFHELFTAHPITAFGHASVDNAKIEIDKFYTLEQQQQYGVLGIAFRKI